MEITLRTQFFVRMFCLIIILSLCFAVWYNGRDLSCSKCSVKFENRKELAEKTNVFSFNVSIGQLYNEYYKTGECPLTYSKDSGFMYSGVSDGYK